MADREPRLDTLDIMLIGGLAAFFDFLSFIPVFGSLGMGILRMIFWFKGINGTLINGFFGVGAAAEAIPGLSLFPSCLAYVAIAVMVDRATASGVLPADDEQEEQEQIQDMQTEGGGEEDEEVREDA